MQKNDEYESRLLKIENQLATYEPRIIGLEKNTVSLDQERKIISMKEDILYLRINLMVEEVTNYFYQFTPSLCVKAKSYWEKRKRGFNLLKEECIAEKINCTKYITDMTNSLEEELNETCS